MLKFTNNHFPSQVVSDTEKISYEYGLKIAKAIEAEWFTESTNTNRWENNNNNFHNLRLYARGENQHKNIKMNYL